MKIDLAVLGRQFSLHQEEYEEAALRVLRSGWYILGPELKAFEHEFAEFVGAKYCVGVNSGLDALTLALRALEIKAGDEVIVPANTYIATVLAITANGATPVFVEPNKYYNLDENLIEQAITKKTKAIMVVHLYGQAALDALEEVRNSEQDAAFVWFRDGEKKDWGLSVCLKGRQPFYLDLSSWHTEVAPEMQAPSQEDIWQILKPVFSDNKRVKYVVGVHEIMKNGAEMNNVRDVLLFSALLDINVWEHSIEAICASQYSSL